jgi:hypothetical protein
MTAVRFEQCQTTVLIRVIDELRVSNEFTRKPAILLINNCFIHTGPGSLPTLREHNVKAVTFPLTLLK